MNRTALICICTVLVSLCATPELSSQPDLNFKRLRLEWPYVEVYLSVGCDGVKNYFLQRGDISIREDGREINDFGIWCPDPTSRCPITVGLVFDASNSMVGEGNAGAKEGGYNFISYMDNVVDEASVVFFNHTVTVFQHTTTDTNALKRAVSYLPTTGSTALWDGIYTSLIITHTQGSNQCRAVIVLSDGEDNSSGRNLEEVVAYAVLNNIRVFTIGYGDEIREDQLMYLAQITGGEYFQTPDASQLASIYKQISTIIYEFFQECLVNYEPRCADGMTHEVELGIPDLCGGEAYSTRSYAATLDSTTFRTKHLSLGEVDVSGGAEARVPLILQTPFFHETLYPMTIDLDFDPHGLQLDRVEAPEGSLLAGMNVHSADLEHGGRIRIPENRVLEGSDTLCICVFRTSVTSKAENFVIKIDSIAMDKGCLTPEIQPGLVRLTPSQPGVSCQLQAPTKLNWIDNEHRYDPNPIEVSMRLYNDGTLSAQDGRVRIEFDPMVFEMVEPTSLEQVVGALSPGDEQIIRWKLSAKGQGTAKDAQICMRATFENHPDVVCCQRIEIPTAGLMLACAFTLPGITYDAQTKAFTPNPLNVQLQVRNVGVVDADTLSAVLQLPVGLYVESGETYEKALLPYILTPGARANTSWDLRLLSALGGDRLPIRTLLRRGNEEFITCVDTLVVPWIAPEFTQDLYVSGPLAFCEGDSVILDAGAGFTAYKWTTGHSTRRITVRKTGSYFASFSDAQGRIGRSNTVAVTVYPMPARPTITRQHNTLITDATSPLQWYYNGIAIPGGTGQRITVTKLGSYEVVVWTNPLCSERSIAFAVSVLPVHTLKTPASFSIAVYPDPTEGSITVELTAAKRESVHMRLVSVLGAVLIDKNLELRSGMNRISLDLSSLPRGVYLLFCQASSGIVVRNVVKQ